MPNLTEMPFLRGKKQLEPNDLIEESNFHHHKEENLHHVTCSTV